MGSAGNCGGTTRRCGGASGWLLAAGSAGRNTRWAKRRRTSNGNLAHLSRIAPSTPTCMAQYSATSLAWQAINFGAAHAAPAVGSWPKSPTRRRPPAQAQRRLPLTSKSEKGVWGIYRDIRPDPGEDSLFGPWQEPRTPSGRTSPRVEPPSPMLCTAKCLAT